MSPGNAAKSSVPSAAVIQSSLATTPALPASPDRPDWLDSAMVLNRRLGWLPGVQNNSADTVPRL